MPDATIKLFAILRNYLPADAGGQAVLDVPEGATVGDLLTRLGVPRETAHLIRVNGEAADWETPVADGDRVSVFPPVAGG